jgi:uncharacterized membrane protein
MSNMKETLSGFVIGLFVLAGVLLIFPALGVALSWKLPGSHDLYFRSEFHFLDGALSLMAALGIYRKDSRIWLFAIFVAGLNLLGGLLATWLAFNLYSVSWLLAWGAATAWLCWPSVRAQFHKPDENLRLA